MKSKIYLIILLAVLLAQACKKDNDNIRPVKRGQIVKVHQDMGKGVQGPFRVDSLYAAYGDIDYSNWYYITSNNGVMVFEDGYYMENCNSCTYTWVGPSKYIPDPYTNGDTVLPRGDNQWGL